MSLVSNPASAYSSLVLFILVFFAADLNGVPVNENDIEVPIYLYKIIEESHWKKSEQEKKLLLTPADDDFIHLSEEHQLDGIIKKFFPGKEDVIVLKIDVSSIKGKLVKESNPGGKNRYFHLYDGFIPFNSILLD